MWQPTIRSRVRGGEFLNTAPNINQILQLALLVFCISSASVSLAQQAGRANERIIVTTNGDSLSTISQREFGSVAYGRLIAEYNQLSFSAELKAGQTLRIPLSAILNTEGADVVFVKGETLVLASGERSMQVRVSSGDRIYASDIIKTSETGFLSLRFPSGTIVNIQPNSLVELRKLDCLESNSECIISIDTKAGAINSNVRKRGDQSTRFDVRTPHAFAAVRGTVFDISASSENMLMGVTEGAVEIGAQGVNSDVQQGLGVRTLAGQPPDPPIKLLAAPDFRRAPIRVTEEDSIAWFPVDDADHYLLSVAEDSDGSVTRYSEKLQSAFHRFKSLPAGEFYLDVRAVDEIGFKGFVAQIPFLSVELDATEEAPSLKVTDREEERFVSADVDSSAAGDYEVQVAYNPDFRDPIIVDAPADGGIVVPEVDVPTYARTRAILNATSVSAFGPVLTIPAR